MQEDMSPLESSNSTTAVPNKSYMAEQQDKNLKISFRNMKEVLSKEKNNLLDKTQIMERYEKGAFQEKDKTEILRKLKVREN